MKALKVLGLVATCLFGLAVFSNVDLPSDPATRAETSVRNEARRDANRKVKEARRARENAWSGAAVQAQVFFEGYLRDYDSAKFDWGYGKDPELRRWAETSWKQPNGSELKGWQLAVPVNSKNGFGAYAGEQTYWFLFQGGLAASTSGAGRLVEVRDGSGRRIYP